MKMNQKTLKEYLNYDSETGVFMWKKKPSSKTLITNRVGWIDGQGYLYIRLRGKLYVAQRLVFLYMTGEWPEGVVDHINRDVGDNSWGNLRDVPKGINQENRVGACKNNKSGLLGVSPNGERWTAKIGHLYRQIYLGTFDTPEEAHKVYLKAKCELHEGFIA